MPPVPPKLAVEPRNTRAKRPRMQRKRGDMERALQGQATGRWDGREWLVAVTIAVLVALGFVRRVQADDVALEPLVFEGAYVDGCCPSASCPPDCCTAT